MSPRGRNLLFLLLGAGFVARVVLGYATVGWEFDIDSYRLVNDALRNDPLDVYTTLGTIQLGGLEVSRWPYPSGIFPWALATASLEHRLGLPFDGTIHLLASASDIALAWVVQDFLGRRGASERTRLAAAALVVLGPAFWMISAYHGQIDSLAMLPAVIALVLWDRARVSRRALYAGLLIGVGGAIKTVPLLMLLPLLLSVRSWREGVTLVGAAGAVWIAAMAPWLLTDFDNVRNALEYSGAPGLGGVTLVLQPELATANLTQDFAGVEVSSLVHDLHDATRPILLATLAGVAALLIRFRPDPLQGAVLMWLAVYAVAPAFFFQYAIWGLPFFVMAGHLRKVAALQAVLFLAMLVWYRLPWEDDTVAYVYVPLMGGLWLSFVVALFAQAALIVRGPTGGAAPAAA